jgi:predicted ester cyclase
MDRKAIYRRFVDEVVVGGNIELIDELFTANAVLPRQRDLDGLRAQMEGQKRGLKLSVAYEHQFEDGDWVITHMTVTGKMIGEFMGHAPTGRTASAQEIEVARVEDGRIVEMWSVMDITRVLIDLGLPVPDGD